MFDFTVILTTFNRPTMLRRAVLSIANQHFDELVPKLQLIVADDSVGGHPETLACLSGIVGLQDLQLVCLKRAAHEPCGVARSRNRALSMAIGKWIVFLDDDDALEPLALSRIASTANRQDADFISGGYSVVHETESGEVDRVEYSSASSLSYDHLLLSNYFPIGSFAVKKESLTKWFDPGLLTHEDWLFLLDNLRGRIMASTDERLVKIYKRGVLGGHRNEFGGLRQKFNDYSEIYRRHPAQHLQAIRVRILKGLDRASREDEV